MSTAVDISALRIKTPPGQQHKVVKSIAYGICFIFITCFFFFFRRSILDSTTYINSTLNIMDQPREKRSIIVVCFCKIPVNTCCSSNVVLMLGHCRSKL